MYSPSFWNFTISQTAFHFSFSFLFYVESSPNNLKEILVLKKVFKEIGFIILVCARDNVEGIKEIVLETSRHVLEMVLSRTNHT